MCAQELLQCGVAFVVEMQRQLPGELRCLNEQYILTLRKLRIFEKRCLNLQVACKVADLGLANAQTADVQEAGHRHPIELRCIVSTWREGSIRERKWRPR